MIQNKKAQWNSTSSIFLDYLPWDTNHDRLLQLISVTHIDMIIYTIKNGHTLKSTPYDESIFLIPNILSTINPRKKSLEHSINPYHEYMSKLQMLLNYPARCSIIADMYIGIINDYHNKHIVDETWSAIWISAVVVAIRIHTTISVNVNLIERLYNVKKGSLKKPIRTFLRLLSTTSGGIGIKKELPIQMYFNVRSYYIKTQDSQELWQQRPITSNAAKQIITHSPNITKKSQDDYHDIVPSGRYVLA